MEEKHRIKYLRNSGTIYEQIYVTIKQQQTINNQTTTKQINEINS